MGSSYSSRSYSPNSGQPKNNNERRGTISRTESSSQYVESVVCKVNDLKDNEMKVFDIGDDGKVLLVKQKGEFSAVGTKCTHYGAPLVSGALGDGRVRCPWHGACFNLKSGDIEDFPGFDSLPCYQVTVTAEGEVKSSLWRAVGEWLSETALYHHLEFLRENWASPRPPQSRTAVQSITALTSSLPSLAGQSGALEVKAKISDLKSNKRTKDMTAVCSSDDSSVVIVGGGPSGATCAETLRSEGFTGRITVVSKENYLPYDRIKVSKIGTITDIEKLQARPQQYYQDAHIDILKGVEVTKVEPQDKKVVLNNGSKLRYSALYLATGSKPRVPGIPGIDLKNIFTVRNFEDSMNILSSLGTEKDKDVVVLGLSFIGLEAAASCNEKAKSMTVVGKDTAPLGVIFGREIGASLQKLFEDKGVNFHFETTITHCHGENGVIKSVQLENGVTLPADMLILGVGTTFYTDFLNDSGIEFGPNGSINVSDKLETNVKDIYAGGDIAYAPVFAHNNDQMTIGHVGLAQYHGKVAAMNILKKETPLRTVPYFWTMLFGKSIRYAGCGKSANFFVDGDVAALKFVIFFFDASDKVIAVASCMRDPVVSQFAELLYQGKAIYKKDLKDDPLAWTKNII